MEGVLVHATYRRLLAIAAVDMLSFRWMRRITLLGRSVAATFSDRWHNITDFELTAYALCIKDFDRIAKRLCRKCSASARYMVAICEKN